MVSFFTVHNDTFTYIIVMLIVSLINCLLIHNSEMNVLF